MDSQNDSLGWDDPEPPESSPKPISAAPSEHHADEFDILLCFRVLLSYWWVLAPLAVIGAAAGWMFWVKSQPVYRAYCRFEIFQNALLELGAAGPGQRKQDTSLWRHILVMKSGRLNDKIRKELSEAFKAEMPKRFKRHRVKIVPVKDAPGSMLDITVDSFSKEYSIQYLHKLIEGYQEMRLDETDLLNDSTLANLRHEQNNLAAKLDRTQSEIAEFEADHNIYFVREKTKSDQALLTSLMNRQSQLRTQLAILESQFPFLANEDAATLRDVLDLTNRLYQFEFDPESSDSAAAAGPDAFKDDNRGWSEVPQWRANEALILRLNAEYEDFLKVYKPGHIKMVKLKEQIDAAKRELEISADIAFKRLQSIRDALKMQEEALLKTAQSFRMEINLTSTERAEYEKLKAREEHLKGLYDQVYARIIDNTATSTDKFYSRYVDGPMIFSEPVWPVKWKAIAISVGLCLTLGCGLILLSYFVKVKLYDYHALEQSLNLTCLAGIPKFKQKRFDKKKPLESAVVLTDKNEFASECYRSLRTKIEHYLSADDRILMVTSPDPGEGKTFSILNLAIVFSWSRKKVLIIDGDFRRMTFRKFFKNRSSNGLTDCLSSETVDWRDCVHETGLEGVDYLPAGHMNSHITELLTMPRLSTILDELSGEYEMILIDSAPVNRVVDTIVLAKHVDGVILIAKAGKTKTHSLRYCHSRLGTANILGYILNNIDSASKKYGYYSYGYSYYSTYHQYNTYYKSYYGDKALRKESESAQSGA